MDKQQLEAIRARDADYNDVFEAQASMSKDIAHRLVAWPVADRRALLAYVDALAAENAALKAQLAYAASTGDECAIEVESLRSRLADLEAERELIVQRAENAEAALVEADERHSRYVKAVGELSGMAARIQDAQRYRWLVGQNDPIIWDYLGGMDDDQIDEAIDKWIADDAHLSRKADSAEGGHADPA